MSDRQNSIKILISGTPGVGKTRLSHALIEKLNNSGSQKQKWKYINIGDFAKSENCIESFDVEYNCHVLDEEQLIFKLEQLVLSDGIGNNQHSFIFDYHGADLFPDDFLDKIFVLRSDNSVLFDRLTARGYTSKKLEENLECEIFQTIYDEAVEAFGTEFVEQLVNNEEEDFERNIAHIEEWINRQN